MISEANPLPEYSNFEEAFLRLSVQASEYCISLVPEDSERSKGVRIEEYFSICSSERTIAEIRSFSLSLSERSSRSDSETY